MLGGLLDNLTPPHVCCFCGQSIARSDGAAVQIAVSNLWAKSADAPVQALFAHAACAETQLHDSVSFDGEALTPE
jgi:hypothetical protein